VIKKRSCKKSVKKGAGYFFWKKDNGFCSWIVHIEKVACPLFSPFFCGKWAYPVFSFFAA